MMEDTRDVVIKICHSVNDSAHTPIVLDIFGEAVDMLEQYAESYHAKKCAECSKNGNKPYLDVNEFYKDEMECLTCGIECPNDCPQDSESTGQTK